MKQIDKYQRSVELLEELIHINGIEEFSDDEMEELNRLISSFRLGVQTCKQLEQYESKRSPRHL